MKRFRSAKAMLAAHSSLTSVAVPLESPYRDALMTNAANTLRWHVVQTHTAYLICRPAGWQGALSSMKQHHDWLLFGQTYKPNLVGSLTTRARALRAATGEWCEASVKTGPSPQAGKTLLCAHPSGGAQPIGSWNAMGTLSCAAGLRCRRSSRCAR